MDLPIEWLPDGDAPPEQLVVLLHGEPADAAPGPGDAPGAVPWRHGGGAEMAPLAQLLRAEYPRAAILAPSAPSAPGAPAGGWWGTAAAVDTASLADRVDAALPPLLAWLQAQQTRLRVGPAATALAGFGSGATLALEAAQRADGCCGRVLAFAGRYAVPPTAAAPRHTTLHLLHGAADPVVPVAQARQALALLAVLQGDATLDVAEGVGHALHPALVQCALQRLRSHIPARTWAAALGSVPALPGHG